MDDRDEPEEPPAGNEPVDMVPGTQFSQDNEDENEEGGAPAAGEGAPSGTEPNTPVPSRRLFSGAEGPGADDEEEEVAATPAVNPAARRQLAGDEEDLAEEILSSVRKPRQPAGAGAGGDDSDEEEGGEEAWGRTGGGSVTSGLSGRRSRASRAGGNDAGEGNPDADDGAEDEDDDGAGGGEVNPNDEDDPETLIRGTDVHVQSAAAAFRDFVRTFVSVEDSARRMAREARRLGRRRRRAAGGGGGGDDDDDDGDDTLGASRGESTLESDDEDDAPETKAPVYLNKLEQILLRGKSDAGADSLTSAAAEAGAGRVGVASLDLDALHLHFHSPECQRLYTWLVDYPSEIVPLMDILLGRELETLRDNLRLRQEELLAEAEASGDDEGIEAAAGVLELLPAALPRVQVRPFHLRTLSHMRALDPGAIDTLLSVRGMVVRTSPVIPDLKVAFFQCSICGQSEQVTIDRGRIAEPTQCPTCHVRNGYSLVHNRCYFGDKQMVRVQETPDEVPAGETPASIVVFAYDDLVDAVRPGDRVEVTGVFRAQARRVNPKVTKVKSVYKTYVDAIHFRKVVNGGAREREAAAAAAKKTGDADGEKDERPGARGKGPRTDDATHGSRFSPERIAELEALSQEPDVYDRLVKALAPSIWEMDDVKKGVLCMLFGGNSQKVKKGTAERRKNREKARRARRERMDEDEGVEDTEGEEEDRTDEEDEDEGGGYAKLKKRGDINILLVGDPGTSKSQLLGYVHKLSPRGVYTSGKGSSAVGLTASVVRDPETREFVMESGALVLSDLGICCIDEFDKMSQTTRAILHEAMEQQTVSIAKAGIIATLNSRTSILASANPVESRYNPSLSVVENIQLPPTLLSRFDLIYLILDAPNVANDRMLAQHLVGLYYETPDVVEPPLDHGLLRDYIAYARENIHPELSDLASRELIAAYIEMRRGGSGGSSGGRGRTIAATPRQLESLVRLSESLARMRYGRVVTRDDVREAVRLMKVATQAAATDPRTGRIDMDMIATGRSTAERELEENLAASLKELLVERRGNRLGVAEVRRQLSEILNVTVQQEDLADILRVMDADGLVQFNERAQTVFVRAGVIG
ncbi:hypothetical protein ACHAXT_007006 [Thalassiosira profunda]